MDNNVSILGYFSSEFQMLVFPIP